MDRQLYSPASLSGQQFVPSHAGGRRLAHYAALPQQPAKAHRVRQIAAVPPFTEDAQTVVHAGMRVAVPVQQHPQQHHKHNGWTAQLWGNALQQQDDPQTQLNDQQQQQHQRQHRQQQQVVQHAEPVTAQLQRCQHWAQVAAVISSASHEQHQLRFTDVTAALQQLNRCVQPDTLPRQARQQLDSLLSTLAETAVQQLHELHHQEVGQLLASLQVLGFKPSPVWVKSVLQHAGTELVHYTPAELALLLLTATQTAARVPGCAPPPMQLMRSSPTAAPAVVMGTPAAAADGSGSDSGSSINASAPPTVRRTNMVLTSAWLQHFMTTFERYIEARTAHPQLQPQHLEAVITCLAALQVTPDRFWLYLFVRQMTAQLPACPPASAVRIMAALASMGYRLPDHVISQIERLVGGPALASLRPQDCVEVVKSVAALKQKPSDAWMQQVLAAILRGSSHLNANAVVTLMVCTAALGINLDPSWIDCLLMQARAALHALSAPEHVGLMDALSQQQHRPGPVFMSLYMTQVQTHLPELSLGQQAVLISSLAAVGYKPAPAWMSEFMGQLAGHQVTANDAPELLKLLTALRRMQYVPNTAVSQQLEGLVDSIAVNVQYNQLLQLRAALSDLQYRPYVAAAAVETGSRRGAVQSTAAAPAAGIPASAANIAAVGAAVERAEQDVSRVEQSGEQLLSEAVVSSGVESSEQQQQQQSEAVANDSNKPASVMQSLELFA